jgi:phospholipid N-methyltransferase
MQEGFLFLKNSLRHFYTVGSFAPSSRFLAAKIAGAIEMDRDLTMLELGAGTGSVTKALLGRLSRRSELFVTETNKEFLSHLRSHIQDPRLRVVDEDVSLPGDVLRGGPFDVVISGLPLANFSKAKEDELLRASARLLKVGGTFLQFQYSRRSLPAIQKYFRLNKIEFEPRNIFPAFLYICTKLTNVS